MSIVDDDIIWDISGKLINKNLLIATAESCTGGLIANKLTNISGSSEYFERGIVSYSNRSKVELLGVPEDIITRYGAVSKETAKEMAIGIMKNANVDIGLSTTGIAGPTGGSKQKPVGLVFIGIATKQKTEVNRFIFSDNRINNKELACNEALKILLKTVSDW